MGLFGGGNSTAIGPTTYNVGFNEVQGPAASVIGDGKVTITYTDQGAVAGGINLAGQALDVGRAAFDTGERTFKEAVGFADRSRADSFNLAGKALDINKQTNSEALGFVERRQADVISKFESFASRTTAQNDERIITAAKWAVGAVVAALVLPPVLKRVAG